MAISKPVALPSLAIPSDWEALRSSNQQEPYSTHPSPFLIVSGLHNVTALTPPSDEDFIRSKQFAFPPGQHNRLIDPKSWSAFLALGRLADIEKGLRTT